MRDNKGNNAFYDTNVLIAYLFKEENRFDIARNVLRKYFVRGISIISIHEIHLYSLKFNIEGKFLEIKDLIHRLFKIIPITQDTCIRASHLRRDYKLPEIDSLILATAINMEYRHFYTFDKDFETLDNKKLENTVIHYLR